MPKPKFSIGDEVVRRLWLDMGFPRSRLPKEDVGIITRIHILQRNYGGNMKGDAIYEVRWLYQPYGMGRKKVYGYTEQDLVLNPDNDPFDTWVREVRRDAEINDSSVQS